MKRISIIIAACALFTAATLHAQRGTAELGSRAPGISVKVLPIPVEKKTVKGLPYSAEIVSESIQTLADGNRIVHRSTARVFRDSEGRVRREEDRPGVGPNISITDPTTRMSYSLDPEQRVAVARPAPLAINFAGPDGAFNAQFLVDVQQKLKDLRIVKLRESGAIAERSPEEADRAKTEIAAGRGGRGSVEPGGRGFVTSSNETSVEERLQNRLIGSILASGTRRTTTLAAGAIGNERPIEVVSEEWFSPDLQILVLTERTDPRAGRSTYELSNINRNEPDPSLFQIPADYTVVNPMIGGRGGRGVPKK